MDGEFRVRYRPRQRQRRQKGNGLTRSDYWTGNLSYKLNKWVSFTNEVTYYDTRAATNATSSTAPCTPGGKLFSGQCVNVAHAWRQEFGQSLHSN